jgi:hypothetical protein
VIERPGSPKQVQPELRVELVPLERLDDALGREPLMHEQRERGHLKGEPLRLARPVQERRAHRLEPLRSGARVVECF